MFICLLHSYVLFVAAVQLRDSVKTGKKRRVFMCELNCHITQENLQGYKERLYLSQWTRPSFYFTLEKRTNVILEIKKMRGSQLCDLKPHTMLTSTLIPVKI